MRKHVAGVVIPGASRGPAPKGEGRVRRPVRPSSGKGNAPGREKPRRARRPPDRGDTDAASQPAWGENPCSEAVPDPPSGTAAIANGGTRDPDIAPRAEAERRRGTGVGPGRCVPPIGSARSVSRDRAANRRKGGDAERRTRSRPGQALKGEPRGRARMKQAGEIGTGATRRGRLERRGRNIDPEEATPGVVARRGWVAPWGNKPHESR